MMRKGVLVAVGVALSMASGRADADRRNFWLVNDTGETIREVHLSAHGTDDAWSADVLGDALLADGHGLKIVVYGGSSCVIDFRIVYNDGSTEDYLQGRNLCKASAIQFYKGTNYALIVGVGL
jgi:hypothetical protein